MPWASPLVESWVERYRSFSRSGLLGCRIVARRFLAFPQRRSAPPGSPVRLEASAQVQLMGKARKERICPLWLETAALTVALLKREPRSVDEATFVSHYGRPLRESRVRFRLRPLVATSTRPRPRLGEKHVTPHAFRPAAAGRPVAARVDVTVIQSRLGHVHLDSTFLHAQANVEPTGGR